jgi:hypothetical protein
MQKNSHVINQDELAELADIDYLKNCKDGVYTIKDDTK